MDMDGKSGSPELPIALNADYEAPELTVIGEASDVVLGVAVGGFDAGYQITEADFEFEVDEQIL
jgi:hypothetical protein